MSDKPTDPVAGWPPQMPPPRTRPSRFGVLAVVLAVVVAIWATLGGLLLMGMIMYMGLEDSPRPEHVADFNRTGGIWILGIVVGVVAIMLTRRQGRH